MEGAKYSRCWTWPAATTRYVWLPRQSNRPLSDESRDPSVDVAPMGLAGMPGTWTRLMRRLLQRLDCVAVYLDDICIYSQSFKEHIEYIRIACEILRGEKLYVREEKCAFGQPSVDFLGHVIFIRGAARGLAQDQGHCRMASAGREGSTAFLAFAGYYHL